MEINIDRAEWPQGEWDNEPNFLEWVDTGTGLSCRILRTSMGNLCGYVGLNSTHELFNKEYNEIYEMDIDPDVHGGLTFSGKQKESELWWLGFDCAHLGDKVPGMMKYRGFDDMSSYRGFDYVKRNTEHLAQQINK